MGRRSGNSLLEMCKIANHEVGEVTYLFTELAIGWLVIRHVLQSKIRIQDPQGPTTKCNFKIQDLQNPTAKLLS